VDAAPGDEGPIGAMPEPGDEEDDEDMPVVVAESLFDDTAVAEDTAKNDMVNLVVKAELKQPIFIRLLSPPIHAVNPARAQVVDDARSSLSIPQR